MEFQANEYAVQLKHESKQNNCLQGDPHCQKNFGELCERGCFEVAIDLQTMTVVKD